MFKCPECGGKTRVIDSRDGGATASDAYTIRRRVCNAGHRFTTYEMVVQRKIAGRCKRGRDPRIALVEETPRSGFFIP